MKTIPTTCLLALALGVLANTPSNLRADSLLDAVIWDGPSTFTAQEDSAAPSAPGGTVPEDSSDSHAEPEPVIESPAPVSESTFQTRVGMAEDTVASPDDAGPTDTELELRRELQEMRDRADRLETALKQAEAEAGRNQPAASDGQPPVDWTGWPSRGRVSFHVGANYKEGGGYYGDDTDGAAAGALEVAIALGELPFDVDVRGFGMGRIQEETPDDYSDFSVYRANYGIDLMAVWVPLRHFPVSPYAGAGFRYEGIYTSVEMDDRYDDEYEEETTDAKASAVGRVGLALSWRRLALRGEYIFASESKEIIGEVGIRIAGSFVLNAFVEQFDIDLDEKSTVFGGGFSIIL